MDQGTNVTYSWDFGDGQNGVGALANHTYGTTGTYTATVTARNSLGAISATTIVAVTPLPEEPEERLHIFLPVIRNR